LHQPQNEILRKLVINTKSQQVQHNDFKQKRSHIILQSKLPNSKLT